MEAGRELDALVAETVFNLRRVQGADVPEKHYRLNLEAQVGWVDADGQQVYCETCGDMPAYSRDIAAAWQVVEKINEEHGLEFTYNRVCEEGEPRFVQFEWCGAGRAEKYEAAAETVPLAICLAALAAVGHPLPQEGNP